MPRFEHHRRFAHSPSLGRRAVAAFAACLAAALSSAAAPVPAGPPPQTPLPPALMVLGDSLSASYGIRVEEGWVSLLERRLASQGYGYRVVNASVSGETTAGALARLPHLLTLHQPRLVVIELGANDGLRGLPVASMRGNLEQLVRLSQAAGARGLLVGMRMPNNYGPRYRDEFQASYVQVAEASHVALVPFLLERIALDDDSFQGDRMHPVARAESALLDTVWPVLEPLLRAPRTTPRAAH